MMPLGDATLTAFTIGPMGTGVYAWWLLGEPLSWRLGLLCAINVVGAVLVLQPPMFFGSASPDQMPTYSLGLLLAIGSGLVSGLLPVLNRHLAVCHWTTVQHASDLLSLAIAPMMLGVFAAAQPASFARATSELLCVLQSRTHLECAPSAARGPDSAAELFPRPLALPALLSAALMQFIAIALQTHGYQTVTHTQHANLTVYLEVATAFVLQHFLFGDEVNAFAIMGASVIVGASVVNVLCAPPQNAK